ncbi:kinase-like protein [Auriscalpium vulgare]|uniref:Kinase-like protein n=1 Tax=Auriscalpium vulgare TaxID=40419 RepID=A0ACB8RMK1_9AGAM|nr:kinase-like protein [Auriscalpium vulgare]
MSDESSPKPFVYGRPENPKDEDPGAIGMSHDKKYYEITNSEGGVFLKRSICKDEWVMNIRGNLVVPCMPFERIKNEAAAIEFIRTHTAIPLPTVRAAFADRTCYYLITDLAPGVPMVDLTDDQKVTVIAEVEEHLETLRGLTSTAMGGLLGAACLPFRIAQRIPLEEQQTMKFKESVPYELVFCHGDLSQHNIFVDEQTLKITAIIDWEYAGFYPKEFEAAFWKRPGPGVALEGEENDEERLLAILDECKAT